LLLSEEVLFADNSAEQLNAPQILWQNFYRLDALPVAQPAASKQQCVPD